MDDRLRALDRAARGQGKNHLGELLMRVRQDLRAASQAAPATTGDSRG
jgi:hypothetical protein